MDLMPWMQQQGMLPAAGETVLCAVSGGRDSVCLLHYLASLGRRRGFAVAAAHYNHLMRPTAGRDEAFVAGLCRELSVPLYVERGDVRAIARQEGWGVEEAGRRLRYDFLERTADAIGASRIATAHHLSDQAETVVLNLLRGTGPEGLAGIPPVRGRLIRPLLQTPRQEIEAYLTAHGLGHVEDETNDSMDFTRNRLRQEVWPLLVTLQQQPEHPGPQLLRCRSQHGFRHRYGGGCRCEIRRNIARFSVLQGPVGRNRPLRQCAGKCRSIRYSVGCIAESLWASRLSD